MVIVREQTTVCIFLGDEKKKCTKLVKIKNITNFIASLV